MSHFATPVSSIRSSRLVTSLMPPEEVIETTSQRLPAAAWLQEERQRLRKGGIAADIIVFHGQLALRRLA